MDGWMKRIKKKRRGELQIPAAQLSANVQRPDGLERVGAFDWMGWGKGGTKRHLWTTKSVSHKCKDTHTHAAVQRIVRISSAVSSER